MTTPSGGDAALAEGTDVRPGAVEAVLFDIDGTLVDTNYLHAVAWRRGFTESGFDVPTAWIHHRVGMGSDRLMQELIGEERDDVKQGWRRHFEAMKPEIRAFPGAAALLREVRSMGIRVVLASSSEESDLDALLAALGADEVVDCVTSAGDVGEAKPSPEVFEVAMRKASCDPDRTLVVGDSVWDVLAAKKAGLPCVCVLTGGIAARVLLEAGAVAVYRDVEELRTGLDRSPLLRGEAGQASLVDLPAELRSRVQAATAHATRRTIRRRGGEAFEVHALAGDRVVHMLLRLRAEGSVDETTETFVRSQIVGVVLSGDRATVELDDGTGRRSVDLPIELGEVLAASA
ncbi:MAG: HAD family hydrolase [Actinomycetota bacterium]